MLLEKPNVEVFSVEKECIFGEEKYSVRDNGAVLRHPKENGRNRSVDNIWTFGKDSISNAYLHIASVRVHRIVATAFHGVPPNKTDVVDHIDTNQRNNRPENLRWLTRLENAIKNPATRKKIEYYCGSIEAFLEDPTLIRGHNLEPNTAWMKTVTLEEAQNVKKRMTVWAETPVGRARSSTEQKFYRESFNKRVFKPLQKWEVGLAGEPGLELTKTLWCAHYMLLRAPAFLPCCPEAFVGNRLDEYFEQIRPDKIFVLSSEEHQEYCPTIYVVEAVKVSEQNKILVKCKVSDTKWLIVGVELCLRTKWFIHFNLGVFDSLSDLNINFPKKLELNDFWSEGYRNAYK